MKTNLHKCLERWNKDVKTKSKINIETRRSTTLKQRVILVQGPCGVARNVSLFAFGAKAQRKNVIKHKKRAEQK